MNDVKKIIKTKIDNLNEKKNKMLQEIADIDLDIQETKEIDEMTNDKDIFSKLTPMESMDLIKKIGVEETKEQREIVLNLINESLRNTN